MMVGLEEKILQLLIVLLEEQENTRIEYVKEKQ